MTRSGQWLLYISLMDVRLRKDSNVLDCIKHRRRVQLYAIVGELVAQLHFTRSLALLRHFRICGGLFIRIICIYSIVQLLFGWCSTPLRPCVTLRWKPTKSQWKTQTQLLFSIEKCLWQCLTTTLALCYVLWVMSFWKIINSSICHNRQNLL